MAESIVSLASAFLQMATRLVARTEHVVVVLRVSLHFSGQGSEICFDLAPHEPAAEGEHRVWKFPFVALGAPSSLLQSLDTFSLPTQLVDGLREALITQDLPADQPLWLDLLRPYGLLGILPWETALGSALARPLLRLPSFLKPPQEDRDIADVAVLLCADQSDDRAQTVWQVRTVADAVLKGSQRLQTRVQVFAPEPWHDVLRSERFQKGIRIHAPPSWSKDEEPGLAGRLGAWVDWISVALEGQTLDAVHFICEAEPSATGAMLMFTKPCRSYSLLPDEAEDGCLVTPATVEDVCAMLTLVGAWGVIITPPAQALNPAPAAFFADAAAHKRPGPLLFHRLERSEDAYSLAEGYRFLLSSIPTQPPRLARGFLYGLPSAVAHSASVRTDEIATAVEAAIQTTKAIAARSPLAERLLTRATELLPGVTAHEIKQVPNWAAAAQRFLETATLDELRRVSGDVLLSRANTMIKEIDTATLGKNVEVVGQTLSDIQSVISQHLSSGTSAVDPEIATRVPKAES